MAVSRSCEEELTFMAAFSSTEQSLYPPSSMCRELNVQSYHQVHAANMQVPYPNSHDPWTTGNLTNATLSHQDDFTSLQMPWTASSLGHPAMSMMSSPGMESTIPATDASPGLMSSPETVVSSRCHTPMESWGLDEQNDFNSSRMQVPQTPNAGFWRTPISCSNEQFIPTTTAYSQFTPAISRISSPANPNTDYFETVEGSETEASRERRISLSESLDPSITRSPAPQTAISHSMNIVSVRDPIPTDVFEQRKRLMEEKTKLVRQRNPRKGTSQDQPTCSICGQTFSRPHNLKSHMQKHNPNPTRPFPCGQCNQSFKRTADLMRHHESIHSEKKKFVCDVCETSFPRKDTLRRHFKVSCLKSIARRQSRNRKLAKLKSRSIVESSQTSASEGLQPTHPQSAVESFDFSQSSP